MQTITLTKSGTYTYTLDQESQELVVVGRFKVKRDEKFHIDLTVIHRAKNTYASISIKAIVDGKAHARINGNIIVEEQAIGTNSFLEERVLLLSSTATAEAVPNLEIKTNDVACSHAATVGQIDASQLFYLASRGLPEKEAKRLIAEAFLT